MEVIDILLRNDMRMCRA